VNSSFFQIFAGLFLVIFRKTFRWGLAVAGTNLISIGFAIILIAFDSIFIQNPGQCYLGTVCYSPSTNITNTTNLDGKSRIIKAQLALTATMLALNITFVIVFIVVMILTRATHKSLRPSLQQIPSPYSSSPKPNYQVQTPAYPPPHQLTYNSQFRQPVYPEPTGQWRPSTPYFNRIEKF
jgi:hypothetical protein